MNIKKNPVQQHSVFRMEGYCVWDPTLIRDDQGSYHLFFSRWPIEKGFLAWITHSEVCRAVAETPAGPFQFAEVVLPRRAGYWDADNTHNPQAMKFGDKYYIYYNGNHRVGAPLELPDEITYANDAWWHQRNNQRVGLAVADRPEGPWRRFDRPLLDVTPGSWDDIVTTNPTCCAMADGRFALFYKGVGSKKRAPYYGPVSSGVAFADSPEGPFTKHPEPLFTCEGVDFPGEDPFVWYQDGRYRCILKDMGTAYTKVERAIALFESDDAIHWTPSANPVFHERGIDHADGRHEAVFRQERPYLYLEDGQPQVFYTAVKPHEDQDDSYAVATEIRIS